MCKKRNEIIGKVLFMISQQECDFEGLADLYSESCADDYYFSSESTFYDLVKDQIIFNRISKNDNGILTLTEKGQLLLTSYQSNA